MLSYTRTGPTIRDTVRRLKDLKWNELGAMEVCIFEVTRL